jgi:type VI secretion system protein ImpG
MPPPTWVCSGAARKHRHDGYAADEALLPESLRAFSGYRLLQEAAAMPQRLLFFELRDLRERLARVPPTKSS